MQNNNAHTLLASVDSSKSEYSRLQDYLQLIKVRLSIVVVFSSLLGYLIASGGNGSWIQAFILVSGGLLVTFAANALNQVLEKDFDILMTRTSQRPVATGRMKSSEAVMFAGLSCLVGISLLSIFNPLTALLGTLSLILYAFVYTPMKRYSTSAVAIGAIPGALPVLIGFTAYEGTISLLALSLFAIQFLWQFPHFWAIGFLGFDDYSKAGYKLLPETENGIDRNLGISTMFYASMILPFVLLAYIRLDISLICTIFVIGFTGMYIYLSYNFHKYFDKKSAKLLMFYSFVYLPMILFSYWLM